MSTKRVQKIPVKYRKHVEGGLRKLSLAIQEAREKQDLTQEELAEILGVSVMTLQFIEQGRRYPSLPMLLYMLRYLGLSLEIAKK